MNSVVIVAAGKGTRMGIKNNLSKQHIEILGKTIIQRTIEKFLDSSIEEIILVISKEEEDIFTEQINKINTSKSIKLVHGGSERFESSLNGIKATDVKSEIILIHDGARPFVRVQEIESVIIKAQITGAAILGVKSKDTIKIVKDEIVESTPDREGVYVIQTPQAFSRNLLIQAYENLEENCEFVPTDDASVVENFGKKVSIVEGKYENIKITTDIDLIIGKSILEGV